LEKFVIIPDHFHGMIIIHADRIKNIKKIWQQDSFTLN